ncbi:MAG: type II secretion system protein GspH [Nitrospirae bacterium]|nr:MAG: type II secretion system protein GspH [Nitrospirota bacterium]
MRPGSEQGFSLVEVMTVVAIMALATAIAIPSYQAWYAKSKLKSALLELNSNMNVARTVAKNRNTTITVTVAITNGQARATYTTSANTSAACLADTRLCAIETQNMPTEVTAIGGTTTFQFNSLGLRVGGGTANQALQLMDRAGLTYEIQVTPAGRIRWCTTSPCP